jgi:hypothetical protein
MMQPTSVLIALRMRRSFSFSCPTKWSVHIPPGQALHAPQETYSGSRLRLRSTDFRATGAISGSATSPSRRKSTAGATLEVAMEDADEEAVLSLLCRKRGRKARYMLLYTEKIFSSHVLHILHILHIFPFFFAYLEYLAFFLVRHVEQAPAFMGSGTIS